MAIVVDRSSGLRISGTELPKQNANDALFAVFRAFCEVNADAIREEVRKYEESQLPRQ